MAREVSEELRTASVLGHRTVHNSISQVSALHSYRISLFFFYAMPPLFAMIPTLDEIGLFVQPTRWVPWAQGLDL